MKYYISTFSNATTPNRVEVCDNEGNPIRTLADSRKLREELAAVQRPVREFFTFTTERGDTLNAYIVKPRGFDASQRYPVLLTQYSGPGSQSVSDRWSLDWEDALTDKGYIVVCADGRAQDSGARSSRNRPTGASGRRRSKTSSRLPATWLHSPTSTLHASASTAGRTAGSWHWAAR